MAIVTDILCDDAGDLICFAGDFACGDSTYQHQVDLLWAKEGEYKQTPPTGVGLENYLLDEDRTDLLRKIRMQFASDGMTLTQLEYVNDLKIRANY